MFPTQLLPLSIFMAVLAVASGQAHGSDPLSSVPELVTVPGGCFSMGNSYPDAYHLERPVHEVCLTPFLMGKYTVTRGEFLRFVRQTGYLTEAERSGGCHVYDGSEWRQETSANWRSPGFPQTDDHPVVCISWNDASAYTGWLSGVTGLPLRLPTEAEWEYAARSAGRRERYAGGDDIDSLGWYAGNSGGTTHPVGQKRPNGLGLYDMSGNVWQWTGDWHGEGYYRRSPRLDPTGPATGTQRLFRGGSWFYDARGARTSYRDFYQPHFRSSYLGFRLAAPRSEGASRGGRSKPLP